MCIRTVPRKGLGKHMLLSLPNDGREHHNQITIHAASSELGVFRAIGRLA